MSELGIYKLDDGLPRRNNGSKTVIQLFETKVIFLVDTKLVFKPTIKRCNTEYFGYKSDQPLQIIGQFRCELNFKNKMVTAGFIVIKGQATCLLSYQSSVRLGIVTILGEEESDDDEVTVRPVESNALNGKENCVKKKKLPSLEMSVEERLAAVKESFPSLFRGKLGCLKGREVVPELDPTVKPKRQPLRPIAFHWRDAVEEEIIYYILLGKVAIFENL